MYIYIHRNIYVCIHTASWSPFMRVVNVWINMQGDAGWERYIAICYYTLLQLMYNNHCHVCYHHNFHYY